MKKDIFSNLFITVILLLPLLLITFGINSAFVGGLIKSLNVIFSILIILNLIGLLSLQTIRKFSSYIDTKDLLAENAAHKKLESRLAYKIYKKTTVILLFCLLIYNRMHLTTIFACVWWLSNHFFKINFDKFTKELEE